MDPKILKGTRDFGHLEMAKRQYVKDVIRKVFEKYGYDPIETPVIEYAETILGKYGEEGDKLTYDFRDNGDRHIALRYDQTVPLARYIAMNYRNLPMPFKRYEINRVWRADKPQRGRYREFCQCDVDIIGTKSLLAEVELAAVIVDCLIGLGLENFTIKVNDRKLLDSLLAKLGITDETLKISVIRVLDKLDKIGLAAVLKEFEALGLQSEQLAKFEELLTANLSEGILERCQKMGLWTEDVEEFFCKAKKLGLERWLRLDFSLARGLDYYTGLIFETVLAEGGLGSVAGGGRYANLCGSFCKEEIDGVGIALGFDRLIDALEMLDLFPVQKTNVEVLVTIFDEGSQGDALKLATALREGGVRTELYFQPDKLAKQLKYADKKGIKWVTIVGEDEIKEGKVSLKNMESGEMESVKREELMARLRDLCKS